MRRVLLSFFGAGYLKPAPGTWGSLAALPAAWVLYLIGGPLLLAVAAAVLFFAGVRATEAETARGEDHDPSWIVVDEVVGQWIALLPAAYFAWASDVPLEAYWPVCLIAFLLFRLFDIWKPWIIGRADARGDAMGVMLDDVWAGIFAAVCVLIASFALLLWALSQIPAPP